MMTTAPVQQRYSQLLPQLPGAGLPWLQSARAAGWDRFVSAGLPTQRTEAWKYTSLRSIEGLDLIPANDADRSIQVPDLPAGVRLETLTQALERDPAAIAELLRRTGIDEPLSGLNLALLGDGLVLTVSDHVRIEQPLQLLFANGDGVWHPRLLIEVGVGAQVTVVERHTGGGVVNLVTGAVVQAGATLRHYKHQDCRHDAHHLALAQVLVDRDANYQSFALTTGAKLSRHDVRIKIQGEHATAEVSGAYAIRGRQHADFTSRIDHLQPHGTSRQLVKGVIDDAARGVFQGKAVVHPGAQKTDGHQLHKALLLSDQAEVDAKPELEIYADDVKCGHGATTGELDADALFYLRARGVPLNQARELLIAAFLAEAVEQIADTGVRNHFLAVVADWHSAKA